MKKLYVYSLVLLAGLFLSVGRVGAVEEPKQDADFEDTPAEVTVSDIEGLNNRINDLAKSARVNVLLQAQYANSGVQSLQPKGFKTATGGASYNDLFLGRRAEVSFSGDLDNKQVAYRVQYDFLGSTSTKAGVATGSQLKDYWVRLSYIPFADIQIGQQRYAQGLEARTSSADLDFADSALVTSAVEDRRDLAIQVQSSKVPLGPLKLEYAVALVQGSGQNTPDNNDNKDLAGRIGLTYGEADWKVFVGASGYDGWESTVAAHSGDRNAFGLEGRVNVGGLKLQGEYIQAQLEPGNNYNPSGTALSRPQGWYVSANYRIEDWRPGLRAESYTVDSTVGSANNLNNDVLTAGLDWFHGHDDVRLSVNFEEHFAQYEQVIGQVQVKI
ncbi:MAG TPA: porin [bacterium]|nr:porin [bacterium]